MKQRVKVIVLVLGIMGVGLSVSGALATDGPLANATVSFGQWKTDPPLDRFPNSSPTTGQLNEVTPNAVTIKAGGAINFVISGFHQIAVYDAGTKPDDINENDTVNTTGTPNNVPLINDSTDRIYRGLDPSLTTVPRDRIEAVNFANPGTYLVICTVRPHFVNNNMFGYVKVLPDNGK